MEKWTENWVINQNGWMILDGSFDKEKLSENNIIIIHPTTGLRLIKKKETLLD